MQHKSNNKLIYRHTFILDEFSIILAFLCAVLIRYRAIVNWIDFRMSIYASMIITVMLFEILTFFLYDMRRPTVIVMDPIDNLFRVLKSRCLLSLLVLMYFYVTQRSVLTSRIVMGLFLTLSVVYGYIIRMLYRKRHLKLYGLPEKVKAYELRVPTEGLTDEDVAKVIDEVRGGDYECITLYPAKDLSIKPILTRFEAAGIRTYIKLEYDSSPIEAGLVIPINDSATIPAYISKDRCNVFGVDYAVSIYPEAVRHVLTHLDDLKGEYICFSNVHTTVMAREDASYAKVLNEAVLTFPDGAPIADQQKKRGYSDAERVSGPTFMEYMFNITSDGRASHYFYGSTQETLDALESSLRGKYPNIDIRGMYSPPFRPLTPEEDEADIRRINESGADIVWIGLGAPKQEKWMNAHRGKINAVMMGVGAGFDFHAGTAKRAPKWIQKVGLEWLYRLFTDPKRLFKRYLVTNCKFAFYLLADHIKSRK